MIGFILCVWVDQNFVNSYFSLFVLDQNYYQIVIQCLNDLDFMNVLKLV